MTHLVGTVDGPHQHPPALGVHGAHQILVHHGTLLPQVAGRRVVHHDGGSEEVRRAEHPVPQCRPLPGEAPDDPVVEAVHRVPGGVGSLGERIEQAVVPAGRHGLNLDEYADPGPRRLQRLREGRDGLAVGEPELGDLFRAAVGDVMRLVEHFVVVDDQRPVGRRMDVQLHGIGAGRARSAEGGEAVLHLVARRAAVRDDERLHCSRLSAFLGSIQSGSFSMSCTSAMSSGRGRTVWRYAGYLSASIGWPSVVQCWWAYMPIFRLNFRSGIVICRSRSGMNMLSRSHSFTISWRYSPRDNSLRCALSGSAFCSRSSYRPFSP